MNWVEYLKYELEIVNKTMSTIEKYDEKFVYHSRNLLMGKFYALNIMLLFAEKNDDNVCFEKVCKRICESTYHESIAITEYSQYILKMPRFVNDN